MPTASGLYYFASHAEDVSRPPLLLIHGAGGNHLFWPPQIRRMQDQRILALDLPGHGKSGGLGHHRVEDYAREVIKFMRASRLNAAVLVGHSMGAAIALQIALANPRRVLGLCLVAGGARLRVAADLLQNAAEAETFPRAVEQVTALSFGPHANERLKELGEERLRTVRPSVLHGDFLACDAFDVSASLPRISAPTFIVCGSADRMTPPRYSEFLRQKIPGAGLALVEGAGHMVMLEFPERVGELIASFAGTLRYFPGMG
jgi:pimeloyl-ACP methyl ester carboxylesterase